MPEPSKYAENQWLTATVDSLVLMSEVLADAVPKATTAAQENAGFNTIRDELISITAAFNAGEILLINAEAGLPAATMALTNKLTSLVRKPDPDINSTLTEWVTIIVGQVAEGGTIYTYLLPQGRDTLTTGSIDQQIDALEAFADRLAEQTAKPALVTLGGTVDTFHGQTAALRATQTTKKTALTTARDDMEALRIIAANTMFALAGTGMTIWRATPERVDELYNINIIRDPTQTNPGAPADTLWVPATRTISTTAMPPGATRLEVYRQGPGGVPELLEIGDPGALSVVISSIYTFDPGDLYQLWLQGRNSRGTSAPGPKQNWTP